MEVLKLVLKSENRDSYDNSNALLHFATFSLRQLIMRSNLFFFTTNLQGRLRMTLQMVMEPTHIHGCEQMVTEPIHTFMERCLSWR